MGFRELIDSWRKIIRLATKPDREDYMTSLKMSLLGLTLVGIIAFIVRFILIVYVFPQQP
ncbi:MAG: preprotein translocase subunit SecE [Thermoprotei archaeon]|nr:MAG: preprotein translocase subunit SecE [Thermoprotei archaeon]